MSIPSFPCASWMNSHEPITSKRKREETSERIKAKPRENWTLEEENDLIKAVEKLGTDSWLKIAKYVNNGRNSKQLREKYANHLSPDLFGRSILEEHKLYIDGLIQDYQGQWSKITQVFKGVMGKTYGDNIIKNYANQKKETEGQGNASRSFWSAEEENDLIEAVKHLGTDWKVIANYLKKGRSPKQLREKYLNHLSPGLFGRSILPEHRLDINELIEAHPNDWSGIARIFKGAKGKTYGDNVIKNYAKLQERIWSDKAKEVLIDLVKKLGQNDWFEVAKHLFQHGFYVNVEEAAQKWKSLERFRENLNLRQGATQKIEEVKLQAAIVQRSEEPIKGLDPDAEISAYDETTLINFEGSKLESNSWDEWEDRQV